MPVVGKSASDGFSPTVPQAAEGIRTDPPVSVPIDAKHIPSTRATADPPLDPPAHLCGSRGCRPARNADSPLVVRHANSCGLVFRRLTAPAWRRRLPRPEYCDGSRGGTAEPDVVGVPATSTRSLTDT